MKVNSSKEKRADRLFPSRSVRQADEEGQPGLASDLGSESLLWASNALGNNLATLGRHRLGNEPDEHLGAKGRAPRRPWHSELSDFSGAATDPR